MYCTWLILFVLGSTLINPIQSQSCDLNDAVCVTSGVKNSFKFVTPGIPGLVPSSDPIQLPDDITVRLPTYIYVHSNVTIAGLADCEVTNAKYSTDGTYWETNITCPRLELSYFFKDKGCLGPAEVDGSGGVKRSLTHYEIRLKGQSMMYTSDLDHKTHVKWLRFVADFTLRGKIVLELLKAKLHPDPEKDKIAFKYVQEHAEDFEQIFKYPMMERFMAVYVRNLNTALKIFPIDVLLPAI